MGVARCGSYYLVWLVHYIGCRGTPEGPACSEVAGWLGKTV